MTNYSVLFDFFYANKDSIKFILYLVICTIVILVSYVLKVKFINLKSSSSFVKILQIIVKSIYTPIILFFVIDIVANEDNFFLQYIDEYFIIIIKKIKATGSVFLMWICFANLTSNVENALSSKDNDVLEKKLFTIIMKFIKIFSYVTLTLMVLRLFGFNIFGVIEKAGGITAIVTSAFLLIYRSQFSNIFSGFLILLNKTFKIGNKIILPEKKISGKILDIGLSKIKILTDDQKVITFPNSYLSNTPYFNLSECKDSFISETFNIDYKDYKKISTVDKLIYGAIMQIQEVNNNLPINVYISGMSDKSSILLKIEFFINTVDKKKIMDIKQLVILKSLEIFDASGCHIFDENK